MIAKNFIISIGFLLSKLSYKTLEAIIQVLARIYFLIPQKRKRLLLSNLTHAFPQWSEHKIKDTAKKSLNYLFEMGFFSLIYPHLSCQQRRSTLMYSKKEEEEISDLSMSGKPTLILLPHLSLFETIATSPAFRPSGSKNLGAIYRPNSNPSIDKWINKSRIDLGLKDFLSQERPYSSEETPKGWELANFTFRPKCWSWWRIITFLESYLFSQPATRYCTKGNTRKCCARYSVPIILFSG